MLTIAGKVLQNNTWQPATTQAAEAEFTNNLVGIFKQKAAPEPRVVMFQNIVAEDGYRAASAAGVDKPTEKVRHLVAVLAFRAYAATDGNVVLGNNFRALAAEFAAYLESQELVSKNSLQNAFFVDRLSDYPAVFKELAESARQRGEAIVVEPYYHAGLLHEIARAQGVALHQLSDEAAKSVAEHYYNKIRFRDLVEQLLQDRGPAFHYPRLSFQEGACNGELEKLRAQHAFDEVVRYAASYNRPPSNDASPFLFLQVADAGGGIGNTIVYRQDDGSYELTSFDGDKVVLDNDQELFKWLLCEAERKSLEVTPYLPITGSHSWGIAVTDNAVVMLGQRTQVLSPVRNDYEGFKVDMDSPSDPESIDHETTLCWRVGSKFHEMGFRGPFAIDLFHYLDPQGVKRVGVAEANVRRDGTSFTIGLCLKIDSWREEFFRGRLSLRQDDHCKVPAHLASTTLLIEAMKSNNLPLASKSNPYGVVLITPPVPGDDGKVMVAVAFTGRSDQERDQLRERFYKVMGK